METDQPRARGAQLHPRPRGSRPRAAARGRQPLGPRRGRALRPSMGVDGWVCGRRAGARPF
eukprot:466646-Prymnesium_polylepis.1